MRTGVSIIICTKDRADDLSRTLAAISRCDVPRDMPVELLVLDNGSKDDTAAVTRAAKIEGVEVRHIFEGRRGKGYAYNRGVSEARGDILLFTDDDVRPPAKWIETMSEPIASGEGDAVAGGVEMAPHLKRNWMKERHRTWLACTERLSPTEPDVVVGANMAIGRHVFEKIGGFDPELGPGALGFYDETLVAKQLPFAGFRIAGRLDCLVEHHFDASRLTRRGMMAVAERMGRSDAYYEYHWAHAIPWFEREDFRGPREYPARRRKAQTGLFARRATHFIDCFVKQRVLDWELDRVEAAAYMDQYEIESRRPRNYEKYGVKKVHGIMPALEMRMAVR